MKDESGRIVYANSACSRTFGYTNDELVGRNVSTLCPEPHRSAHDSYLERYLRTREARVLGVGRKLRGCRKDGVEFPMYLSLSESVEGTTRRFHGIIRDLSAEEEQRALTEAIVDSCLESIVAIDAQGTMLRVNRACCVKFGYEAHELVGRNVNMLMGEPHHSAHDSYLSRYVATGRGSVMGRGRELAARRRDGREFPIHLSLSEARVGGKVVFTGIMADLSAEKNALAQTRAMVESALDPIVSINEQGVILGVNNACAELFLYSRDELVGHNVSMLCPEPHRSAHNTYLARYAATGLSSVIGSRRAITALAKDGTPRQVFLAVSEARARDGSRIFTAIARDAQAEVSLIRSQLELEQSEQLLLNILPEPISRQLKAREAGAGHLASAFDHCTILFADVVGFTALSASMAPLELVRTLNTIFSSFDALVDRYKLEKIKTIGDAYMVVSGLSHEPDHQVRMLRFALDMFDALAAYNSTAAIPLGLRCGVNSGPVVAGVLGTKKFLYDLWGDAVNVASRMESTGVAGCVQVTSTLAEVARSFPSEFCVLERGSIKVKGKGDMSVFLIGRASGMEALRHRVRQEAAASVGAAGAGAWDWASFFAAGVLVGAIVMGRLTK